MPAPLQQFLPGKAKPFKTYAGIRPSNRCHYLQVNSLSSGVDKENPLRIIIAGGGLGGLFAAICFLKAGLNVTIIEKTARYRPFGGPIQLASNGIGTVKIVSENLYENINNVARPFWGTESGIRDGLTSEWMFKFEAINELPSDLRLPFSVCIDRSDLQLELLKELAEVSGKENILRMSSFIINFSASYHRFVFFL